MAPAAMTVSTVDEPRKTHATSPTSINTEYVWSKALQSTSSKASSKTKMSSEDLAAMRHFRSVIEFITSNENMSSSERKNNLANFEQFLTETEQRSHCHEKNAHAAVDAGGLEKKKKKKQGWLRSKLLGKQYNSQTNVDDKKKRSKEMGGVLEKINEEADESRGDVVDNKKVTNEVDAIREEAPTSAEDEIDSIMELRMQNSEAFAASVCSLRSLGTFEKDFINNIIAEQANVDERSFSTFEQDYTAKLNDGVPHPTQVFMTGNGPADAMDDLTIDTMLSETTFEKDAHSIMNNCNGGDVITSPLNLPTQITAPSGQHDADVDDDDITIGTFRSETTYERDVRKMNEYPQEETLRNVGSAPTTFAVFDERNAVKGTVSAVSQLSISTYEKNMAALNALAVKIGRKPLTQSKEAMEGITRTASDQSCSTFEQDVAFRKSAKTALKAPDKPYGQVIMTKLSDLSVSTFENDFGIRSTKLDNVVSDMPPPQISQSLSPITEPGSPQNTTDFEHDTTELTRVDQNYNPEWFNDIPASGFKMDNAGGGSGAVYDFNGIPAAFDRNRTGLSDAVRLADAKAEAMEASTRLSKIGPLEVLRDTCAKTKERSIWDRWFS